jgi:hypothetical protein
MLEILVILALLPMAIAAVVSILSVVFSVCALPFALLSKSKEPPAYATPARAACCECCEPSMEGHSRCYSCFLDLYGDWANKPVRDL